MNDEVAVSAKVQAPPAATPSPEAAVSARVQAPPAAPATSEAAPARARELERTRRADAARITALVQYMLHRGEDARDPHQRTPHTTCTAPGGRGRAPRRARRFGAWRLPRAHPRARRRPRAPT